MHDALYVEAMGEKAEIFSNRRALLKELLDRTKHPASVEDKTDISRLALLLDQYSRIDDVKRYILHPVTLQAGMVEYTDESGAKKLTRGIQFACSNWEDCDIPLSDLFLKRHAHESFPQEQRDFPYEYCVVRLQQPGVALTEEGALVQGVLRDFTEEELLHMRRQFTAQQQQSKDGYFYGAAREKTSMIGK